MDIFWRCVEWKWKADRRKYIHFKRPFPNLFCQDSYSKLKNQKEVNCGLQI